MDIVDHLGGAFASTGRIVATVTPDGLRAPTPCAEWDVRALLNHATGVVAGFGAAASRTAPAAKAETEPDFVGTDPSAQFEQAAAATLAAWGQPGALDGTCVLTGGFELPAQVAARINFLDTLVHGWDLARALNVDPTLDPALATAALEVAKQIVTDDRRGPGKGFGPALAAPAGASPTDALVAFLGRRP
jgi:uncharacterized protein (TIGR03086 family)